MWVPPVYPKAAPMCNPQHAFCVNGHSIGRANISGDYDCIFFESDVAGFFIEIKRLDFLGRAVNEVHSPVVERPCNPIRNSGFFPFFINFQISVNAIKCTRTFVLFQMHGAYPKPPLESQAPSLQRIPESPTTSEIDSIFPVLRWNLAILPSNEIIRLFLFP